MIQLFSGVPQDEVLPFNITRHESFKLIGSSNGHPLISIGVPKRSITLSGDKLTHVHRKIEPVSEFVEFF